MLKTSDPNTMESPSMDMLPLAETAPAPAGFDYTSLAPDIASRQRDRAARIVGIYRKTVEAAGEIGRELLAAQEEMEHGTFLRWVDSELRLSKSSAYRFMDVARTFGEKLPTVGSLPLTVVHKLAERSTPEPVRAAVLRRIEAGETIQAETIVQEIREAKDEARRQAASEREEARRASMTPEQQDVEDARKLRGKKAQEAKARVEARQRAERLDVERKEQAEGEINGAYLVERLGLDEAAAWLDRVSDYQAMRAALHAAQRIVSIRRAEMCEPIEVKQQDVEQNGKLSEFQFFPEDRVDAEALAKEIERDGLIEPLILAPHDRPGWRRYQVVDGVRRFRALVTILGRQTFPARIAPSVSPDERAAFDAKIRRAADAPDEA